MPIAKIGMADGFIALANMRWGVGIGLPAGMVEPMIEFGDTIKPTKAVDDLIGQYLKSRMVPILYPMPSFLEHRSEEKSLVGNKNDLRRVAFAFRGE